MREFGLAGPTCGTHFKITIHPDGGTERPLDLVGRNFRAERSNQLWV